MSIAPDDASNVSLHERVAVRVTVLELCESICNVGKKSFGAVQTDVADTVLG